MEKTIKDAVEEAMKNWKANKQGGKTKEGNADKNGEARIVTYQWEQH